MEVKFVDLALQYQPYIDRITKELKKVITSASFVGGPALKEFEVEVAKYIGTDNCVGVGSGTDALYLSLLAYGIGPGDEVIVPANTFIATAFAVSLTGAKVVFVDVDPKTYLMDLHKMFDAITSDTKAIIPVHLYGQCCDIVAIKSLLGGRDIKIIEDCAQAFGSRYKNFKAGSMGDVGCFSFYPAKNLGGLGQGGCITTNHKEIADKVRSLGDVGRLLTNRWEHSVVGFNSRLDAINAKFIYLMLEHISDWNAKRAYFANLYNLGLEGVKEVRTPYASTDSYHIYHLYELKCRNKEERDALREFLSSKYIQTGLHYPIPCHKQKPYEKLNYKLPVAEELADTLISLPMHPNLNEVEIDYVCSKIKEFYN